MIPSILFGVGYRQKYERLECAKTAQSGSGLYLLKFPLDGGLWKIRERGNYSGLNKV
jgi:hypothetical protein